MGKKKLDRHIKIDDSFDEEIPAAKAVRSLLPEDCPIDPAARDRIVGHVLAIQRSRRRNPARAPKPWPRVVKPVLAAGIALLILSLVVLPVIFSTREKKSPVQAPQYARFVTLHGEVDIKAPGLGWRQASSENSVAEGWTIRTGDTSAAAVRFPDGSIMRVTDGSLARVSRITDQEVAIRHLSGGTYHRVHKGTRYSVSFSDVTSRALGTAFNVENRQPDNLEILTIESAVEVAIGKHEPIKVSEGEVMRVSLEQDKKADKQPVSRERLQEERLMASVQQDIQAGYPTGVYENVDMPATTTPETAPEQPQPQPGIGLVGVVTEKAVQLNWTVSESLACTEFFLLRAASTEPAFPSDEIAHYSDTSITSASDNSVQAGQTYEYRVAALLDETGELIYSNTVIVAIPEADAQPAAVSLSVTARPGPSGISLEWSVSGASAFDGFVVERVVEKAPQGSPTPVGSTSFNRMASTDVFCSHVDNSVLPGHTYSYRIGLVVDGSVMAYSDWVQAECTRR